MANQGSCQTVGRTMVTFNCPSAVRNVPSGELLGAADTYSRYRAITAGIAPPCVRLASMERPCFTFRDGTAFHHPFNLPRRHGLLERMNVTRLIRITRSGIAIQADDRQDRWGKGR